MSGFNMPPGVSPNMIPGNEPDDESDYLASGSLTLRDYFAAAALTGLASNATWIGFALKSQDIREPTTLANTKTKAAKQAYEFADAMLKERIK